MPNSYQKGESPDKNILYGEISAEKTGLQANFSAEEINNLFFVNVMPRDVQDFAEILAIMADFAVNLFIESVMKDMRNDDYLSVLYNYGWMDDRNDSPNILSLECSDPKKLKTLKEHLLNTQKYPHLEPGQVFMEPGVNNILLVPQSKVKDVFEIMQREGLSSSLDPYKNYIERDWAAIESNSVENPNIKDPFYSARLASFERDMYAKTSLLEATDYRDKNKKPDERGYTRILIHEPVAGSSANVKNGDGYDMDPDKAKTKYKELIAKIEEYNTQIDSSGHSKSEKEKLKIDFKEVSVSKDGEIVPDGTPGSHKAIDIDDDSLQRVDMFCVANQTDINHKFSADSFPDITETFKDGIPDKLIIKGNRDALPEDDYPSNEKYLELAGSLRLAGISYNNGKDFNYGDDIEIDLSDDNTRLLFDAYRDGAKTDCEVLKEIIGGEEENVKSGYARFDFRNDNTIKVAHEAFYHRDYNAEEYDDIVSDCSEINSNIDVSGYETKEEITPFDKDIAKLDFQNKKLIHIENKYFGLADQEKAHERYLQMGYIKKTAYPETFKKLKPHLTTEYLESLDRYEEKIKKDGIVPDVGSLISDALRNNKAYADSLLDKYTIHSLAISEYGAKNVEKLLDAIRHGDGKYIAGMAATVISAADIEEKRNISAFILEQKNQHVHKMESYAAKLIADKKSNNENGLDKADIAELKSLISAERKEYIKLREVVQYNSLIPGYAAEKGVTEEKLGPAYRKYEKDEKGKDDNDTPEIGEKIEINAVPVEKDDVADHTSDVTEESVEEELPEEDEGESRAERHERLKKEGESAETARSNAAKEKAFREFQEKQDAYDRAEAERRRAESEAGPVNESYISQGSETDRFVPYESVVTEGSHEETSLPEENNENRKDVTVNNTISANSAYISAETPNYTGENIKFDSSKYPETAPVQDEGIKPAPFSASSEGNINSGVGLSDYGADEVGDSVRINNFGSNNVAEEQKDGSYKVSENAYSTGQTVEEQAAAIADQRKKDEEESENERQAEADHTISAPVSIPGTERTSSPERKAALYASLGSHNYYKNSPSAIHYGPDVKVGIDSTFNFRGKDTNEWRSGTLWSTIGSTVSFSQSQIQKGAGDSGRGLSMIAGSTITNTILGVSSTLAPMVAGNLVVMAETKAINMELEMLGLGKNVLKAPKSLLDGGTTLKTNGSAQAALKLQIMGEKHGIRNLGKISDSELLRSLKGQTVSNTETAKLLLANGTLKDIGRMHTGTTYDSKAIVKALAGSKTGRVAILRKGGITKSMSKSIFREIAKGAGDSGVALNDGMRVFYVAKASINSGRNIIRKSRRLIEFINKSELGIRINKQGIRLLNEAKSVTNRKLLLLGKKINGWAYSATNAATNNIKAYVLKTQLGQKAQYMAISARSVAHNARATIVRARRKMAKKAATQARMELAKLQAKRTPKAAKAATKAYKKALNSGMSKKAAKKAARKVTKEVMTKSTGRLAFESVKKSFLDVTNLFQELKEKVLELLLKATKYVVVAMLGILAISLATTLLITCVGFMSQFFENIDLKDRFNTLVHHDNLQLDNPYYDSRAGVLTQSMLAYDAKSSDTRSEFMTLLIQGVLQADKTTEELQDVGIGIGNLFGGEYSRSESNPFTSILDSMIIPLGKENFLDKRYVWVNTNDRGNGASIQKACYPNIIDGTYEAPSAFHSGLPNTGNDNDSFAQSFSSANYYHPHANNVAGNGYICYKQNYEDFKGSAYNLEIKYYNKNGEEVGNRSNIKEILSMSECVFFEMGQNAFNNTELAGIFSGNVASAAFSFTYALEESKFGTFIKTVFSYVDNLEEDYLAYLESLVTGEEWTDLVQKSDIKEDPGYKMQEMYCTALYQASREDGLGYKKDPSTSYADTMTKSCAEIANEYYSKNPTEGTYDPNVVYVCDYVKVVYKHEDPSDPVNKPNRFEVYESGSSTPTTVSLNAATNICVTASMSFTAVCITDLEAGKSVKYCIDRYFLKSKAECICASIVDSWGCPQTYAEAEAWVPDPTTYGDNKTTYYQYCDDHPVYMVVEVMYDIHASEDDVMRSIFAAAESNDLCHLIEYYIAYRTTQYSTTADSSIVPFGLDGGSTSSNKIPNANFYSNWSQMSYYYHFTEPGDTLPAQANFEHTVVYKKDDGLHTPHYNTEPDVIAHPNDYYVFDAETSLQWDKDQVISSDLFADYIGSDTLDLQNKSRKSLKIYESTKRGEPSGYTNSWAHWVIPMDPKLIKAVDRYCAIEHIPFITSFTDINFHKPETNDHYIGINYDRTRDNRDNARAIYEQDWQDMYGIFLGSMRGSSAYNNYILSNAQIDAIFRDINPTLSYNGMPMPLLSDERSVLLKTALKAIGNVQYPYDPDDPDLYKQYENGPAGNNLTNLGYIKEIDGKTTAKSYTGEADIPPVLSSKGFIQWLFATQDMKFEFSGTDISAGTLRPGDVGKNSSDPLDYDDGSIYCIFLGYDNDNPSKGYVIECVRDPEDITTPLYLDNKVNIEYGGGVIFSKIDVSGYNWKSPSCYTKTAYNINNYHSPNVKSYIKENITNENYGWKINTATQKTIKNSGYITHDPETGSKTYSGGGTYINPFGVDPVPSSSAHVFGTYQNGGAHYYNQFKSETGDLYKTNVFDSNSGAAAEKD